MLCRVGGLAYDVSDGWPARARESLAVIAAAGEAAAGALAGTGAGIAPLPAAVARGYAVTGPVARASG
jgi:NADH:ubiquinone oxidoreductase subunit D